MMNLYLDFVIVTLIDLVYTTKRMIRRVDETISDYNNYWQPDVPCRSSDC